jgi:hypothetical protein
MAARHCALVFTVGRAAARADPLVIVAAIRAVAARRPTLPVILRKTVPPCSPVPKPREDD